MDINTPDVPNVTPGDYTVTITGVTGTANNVNVPKTFTFRLVNPCPSAVLTKNTAFVDQNYII